LDRPLTTLPDVNEAATRASLKDAAHQYSNQIY
jgi:hypothetical protein